MSSSASVSVVMSVFDKPNDVIKTIDSVLSQRGVEFELIIVNDGAHCSVLKVLDDYKDARLVRIDQKNKGLTEALINGCAASNSEFIARIDAGDVMLPNRLQRQVEFLSEDRNMAIVGCSIKMVTDEGTRLFDIVLPREELKLGLVSTEEKLFKSFVHSSVMFRRQAYEQVGGYRSEFYFTQDCDLWARIVWAGYDVGMIEDTLQTNVFSTTGISGQHRASQQALEKIIVRMNRLRSSGRSDSDLLSEAAQFRPTNQDLSMPYRRADNFEGDYFIASMLSVSSPKQALIYWRKALAARPWSLKALLKASVCWLRALVA